MPLIIITGYPCSGKTHRTLQIVSDFTTRVDEYNSNIHGTTSKSRRPLSIQHIPSRHSSLSNASTAREEIYTSASAEKTARAAEFSAIKRALNNETVVIADSGNYIKGYRYQLWCEAKAVGTRCCVVHVATREDEAEKWNHEREQQQRQQQGEERSREEKENTKVAANSTRGVKGDSVVENPESHTFIYGDVRNSQHDDDEDGLPDVLKAKRKQHTQNGQLESDLKSLYLNPRIPETTTPSQGSQIEEHTSPDPILSQAAPPISDSEPKAISPSFPPLSPAYTSSTLHALISRYEPPSPFTRWDTPLFTLPSTDTDPPYDEIWNALFPHLAQPASPPRTAASSNPLSIPNSSTNTTTSIRTPSGRRPIAPHAPVSATVKPHAATVLAPSAPAQALQNLERGTNAVVKHILAYAQSHTLSGVVGDEDVYIPIPLPGTPDGPEKQREQEQMIYDDDDDDDDLDVTVTAPPGTSLSLPHLQRLRRRYVQMERSAAGGGGSRGGRDMAARMRDENAVARAFARWIACEFGEGGR